MKLEFETALHDLSEDCQFLPETDSEDTAGCLRAAIEAAQTGNRSEARELLLFVTESEPDNETAWLWLASISEYPEELLVFLQRVLSINPANARALEWAAATESLLAKTFFQRGLKAARENQNEIARQCFRQAVAHEPTSEAARLKLVALSDSEEEKINHLESILSLNPASEKASNLLKTAQNVQRQSLLKKANFAAISGEREAAEQILEDLMKYAPELEEAWILKAYLAAEFIEKIVCYEKVLEINPANEAALAGMESLRAIRQKSAERKSFADALQQAFEQNELFNSPESAEVFSESAALENQEESIEIAETDFAPAELPTAELIVDKDSASDLPNEKEAESSIAELSAEEIFHIHTPEVEAQEIAAESNGLATTGENAADDYAYDLSDVSEEEILSVSHENNFDESAADEFSRQNFAATENLPESNPVNQETPVELINQETPVEADFSIHETETIGFEPNRYYDEIEKSAPAEAATDEVLEISAPDEDAESAIHKTFTQAEASACPFCAVINEGQAVICRSCRAMLSLSDLEMLLAYRDADTEILRAAIYRLESEKGRRALNVEELCALAIAHFNVKNLRFGLDSLREAFKINPNNILLGSKVNFLAIRLAEIEDQQQRKTPDAERRSCTIMIVDDNPTVRRLVAGKLEKCGHAVIEAADGADALLKIGDATPDLILLDIAMPKMDGYQVCESIRAREATKDVPVLMISGKDAAFDAARGESAGSTGFIAKPFGPETLMRAIETYLV